MLVNDFLSDFCSHFFLKFQATFLPGFNKHSFIISNRSFIKKLQSFDCKNCLFAIVRCISAEVRLIQC
jgi:hypothetical protein